MGGVCSSGKGNVASPSPVPVEPQHAGLGKGQDGTPQQAPIQADTGAIKAPLQADLPQATMIIPAQSVPQQEVEKPNQHLQNLKVVAKGGIKAVWSLCTTFKDLLPFPGGAGVALIGEVAGLVSTAISNKQNLEALRDRAVELIVVIVDRNVDLEAVEAYHDPFHGKDSRLYTNLMHRLLDLLKEIKGYAQSYCDRHFILKILMTGHDRDTYLQMVDTLGKLQVDAHFSVSVETHSKVLEVHRMTGDMKKMLEELKEKTPYQDHATKIQEKVESLGGIESVKNDTAKLREVAQHLDPGQQVAMASIQRQLHAGFLAAYAFFDIGVHLLIKHTDMRTLWKTFFDKQQEVSWELWWLAFPEQLPRLMIEEGMVKEIGSRFSDERARIKFQEFLTKGRDHDAKILEHKLQEQLRKKDGNCKAAVCLKASAGMGKSSLGLDVGWKMAMSGTCPAGVLKVDLREARSYEEVLGRFCSTLGMTMDENTTDEIPARLSSLCQHEGGPLMLLLDNAEDPVAGKRDHTGKPVASQDPGNFVKLIAMIAREAVLLITSRVPINIGGIVHHELGGMDDDSCKALLRETLMQETVPKFSDAQIMEVVHICSGVPLLVRLAGDALRTGQLSVEEVREATQKGSDATTAITRLMLQTLSIEHEQSLAQLATFPSGFDEEGAAAVLDWDMPRASTLLVVLWSHGLVSWDASYNAYSLHAMVRTCAVEVAKRSMPGVVRQAQVRFVAFVFQQMDSWAAMYNTTTWPAPLNSVRERGPDIRAAFELAWELLHHPGSHGIHDGPHGTRELLRLQDGILKTVLGIDIESVRPMLRAGGIRYSSTWYLLDKMENKCGGNELLISSALYISNLLRRHEHEDIEKALQIRERLLEKDHPHTLSCLHALALTRHLQTRYSDAEPLYHKAVEARQRVLGVSHPHTLDSIEGLAECIQDLGRYPEAEPLLEDVIEGREKVLGEFHPRTLESNTNMANCHGKQGHQERAEELHRKNLQARRNVLGPDHLKTYDAMNCLAICLRQQGKTDEALDLSRETLAGRRRTLGNDNPATYDTKNNYANCVQDKGNAEEAEGLYREVLHARKQMLDAQKHMNGEDHLSVYECMNNLADCLQNRGKSDEAEEMYHKALEGRQRLLGNHPETFQTMNNLASLLEERGKLEEAESLREAARAGQEERLGLGHPETIKLNRNQAHRLSHKGKHAEAEVLLIKTLDGFKQSKESGKEDTTTKLGHLEDVKCIHDLANCLFAQDKTAEAAHFFRSAMEERARVLPNDHPDLLKSLAKLADCLWNLGDFAAAETPYRAAFEGQQKAHGLSHSDTLSAATDLAKCLQRLEKHEDAEALFRMVTEELQKQNGPDDADTLAAAAGLAKSLRGQGKLREAEQQLKELFYSRERVLGPKNADTHSSLDALIDCLRDRGNTDDLDVYKQKKIELLARTYGQSDKQTIDACVSRGVSLYNEGIDLQSTNPEESLGKYKEAEEQYKQAVEAYTQILGRDSMDTLECLKKQAKSVWAQDDRETDAVALMDDALERSTRALGPDDPGTLQIKETRDKWAN